jgi:hypothetical protein
MKSFVKLISVILITTMLSFITGSIVAGAATTDVSSMATALNRLNILQGNNGDYLLNNKIERSQAATLIIRMLGKENFVKQNAEQLKVTKYADVPSKEWYAPYVGYCTQYNIMGGYPDGRFAPKDFVSEKSFIKMALCALGYVYNTDFDWSNVYQKAFSAGIVTDQAYAAKTQDNNDYLRSDAVKVIFNSLNTAKKGTTTKMVFTLIDEGAFTRDVINASGILGADKPTEIDLVTATGFNSIEVNLNESIQSINAADITITDASATTASAITSGGLTILSAASSGDKIQVITSGQTSNKDYIVKIRSVTDSSGNISGQLTGTFKGFARQPAISDFFKISKIEQVSTNVINVYFTQPVNSNSETPAYYELTKNGATYVAGSSQNITVRKLQSSNNAVSIYINNSSLAQGEVYGLKINGKLTSSYGVKLGEGYGESMEFATTSAADAGQLTVSSAMAWSSTSVRLIYSREVDSAWAEKFLNYTIYDANKTAIAVTKAVKAGTGSESGRTVMLTLASPLDKTKQYEVRIEYVPDVYKQSVIEGKSYSFSGAYIENTDLAISKTGTDYNNCVILSFSRPLDKTSAENTSNYSIAGLTDGTFSAAPVKVYYEDTYGIYTAKLYLPAGKTFSSAQRYVVYITGLKDSSGVAQPAIMRAEFTGSNYSSVKPQLADAVTVSKDAVKLLFSLEIAFDLNNINTSNYLLEYVENGETFKMQPIGVTYVDAKTLVLRFDSLDSTKTYTIKASSVNDYSGVYTRTATEGGNSVPVRWGK